MAALRTQIYLTAEQRRNLDGIAELEGVSLAELIRTAVDEYLESRPADVDDVLAATFGSVPGADAPSRDEWRNRELRVRG